MKSIYIDFVNLDEISDFYPVLKEKLPELPAHFGDNLDALADSLSVDVPMPLHIEFVNLNIEQLDDFEALIATLEELEEELEGFSFSYFLEQFDDENENEMEEEL
jgi:ribonuclease inhibitor